VLEAEHCTTLLGVPAMFAAELEHADFGRFDLSSLRSAVVGGAHCPIGVVKGVRTNMQVDEVTIICG
jgi:fatty-acyl-CoA synthase